MNKKATKKIIHNQRYISNAKHIAVMGAMKDFLYIITLVNGTNLKYQHYGPPKTWNSNKLFQPQMAPEYLYNYVANTVMGHKLILLLLYKAKDPRKIELYGGG